RAAAWRCGPPASRRARHGGAWCASPIRAPGFRRSRWPASSSRSSPPRRRAAGSASSLRAASWPRTAAGSTSRTAAPAARSSGFGFRSRRAAGRMLARVDARGRVALSPLGAERAEALLAPPWIPAAALDGVRLAREAARLSVPVCLRAPAPLQPLLARAPHTALALAAACDDGAPWLLAGLEPGAAPPPPTLAARLAAVALEVPPLARRGADDIAALAAAILDRLARRAGRAAPALAPAAAERLAAHGWPGDVPELETVLARALLVAPEGEPIAAGHRVFPSLRAAAAPSPPAPPAPATQLEALLAELAHELRNPLVTIKTFAEHLPALLEDAE